MHMTQGPVWSLRSVLDHSLVLKGTATPGLGQFQKGTIQCWTQDVTHRCRGLVSPVFLHVLWLPGRPFLTLYGFNFTRHHTLLLVSLPWKWGVKKKKEDSVNILCITKPAFPCSSKKKKKIFSPSFRYHLDNTLRLLTQDCSFVAVTKTVKREKNGEAVSLTISIRKGRDALCSSLGWRGLLLEHLLCTPASQSGALTCAGTKRR